MVIKRLTERNRIKASTANTIRVDSLDAVFDALNPPITPRMSVIGPTAYQNGQSKNIKDREPGLLRLSGNNVLTKYTTTNGKPKLIRDINRLTFQCLIIFI